MERILVIDQDRDAMQQFGLGCLAEGVGVALAETLCDGVRVLLSTSVSLIAVDGALLRLTPRENATLFERVTPGVPVVVLVRPEAPIDRRVALELAGFRVMTRPVDARDLIAKAAALAVEASR